ncbi:MAG: hypothetical protein KF852_16555 [Saprospiraceae bacterium]|nr:hypothetical protein [Saprospiraceae bacterium]
MNTRFYWVILIALCMAAPFILNAQGYIEALRYSNFEPVGTARSLGSGGAFGALGADFSVVSTNPAGLAWYRRGEFTFSPGFLNSNVNATLLSGQGNPENNANRGNFHIGNLGLVITSDPAGPDWRALNFGIGFNRLQNFNRRLNVRGDSPGSIIDRFQELANSDFGLDDFESGLAFDAAAIYDLDGDGFYESDVELAPNSLIRREQTITTSGALSELNFAFGANYKDKIMIGATIGLPFLNYTEEKRYDEEDVNQDIPFFDNLQHFERVATTGVGINLKAGIIVRPHQMIRIGAAVHTPTFYRLTDNYYSELTYNYTESGIAQTGYARSPDGDFRFRLRSPWRFIGSAGVILNKAGLVTVEAEYVNFGSARLGFRDFPVDEEFANERIENNLRQTLNLRLGAEAAYKAFRFRGGVGVHSYPYITDDETPANFSFSGGVGVRGNSAFLDLGYRHTVGARETYEPYLTAQAPQQFVENTTQRGLAVLTLGFRF